MPMRDHVLPALTIIAAACIPGGAAAQIPDTFTNLRVLPDNIARGDLVALMRSFAFGLGVHCNHCHVGENPNDLTGYDFASDDKETKRVARTMLRMRAEINDVWLPSTGRAGLLRVECVTCHHGLARPRTLESELREVLDTDGIDAAIERYRELRERYYGNAAYDFGPGSLNDLTETLTGEGVLDAALAIIRLNLEYYPDEPYPHFLEARVLSASGDPEGALAAMERAAALAPDSEFYRIQLERMRSPSR